jgi:hypothetical protein
MLIDDKHLDKITRPSCSQLSWNVRRCYQNWSWCCTWRFLQILGTSFVSVSSHNQISWYEPLWKSIEAEQTKLAQDVMRAVQDEKTINLIADDLEAQGRQEELAKQTASESTNFEEPPAVEPVANTETTETADTTSTEAAAETDTSSTETSANATEEPIPGLLDLPPYMSQIMGLSPQKLAVITMHTCLSK